MVQRRKVLKRFSWLKLNPSELLKASALLLIAANLIPLYGVLFLDWKVFPILLLFWMENVLVGIFNVFKMLIASPAKPLNWAAKIFLIPFFCFHYGMFTLVHGVFVFGFFGGYFTSGASFPNESLVFQAIADFQLGWPIFALLFSHTVSFVINYIGKGEYKQASVAALMQQPYSRVVLLHLTILIGGFLVMSLGSPVFALLILVLLKIFIDVQAHLKERKKYADNKEPKLIRDLLAP
jgi:hypothetical protein